MPGSSKIICRDVIGGIDERALFEKQTTSLIINQILPG